LPGSGQILIIGCGNPFRGDDAAGILVARRLQERGIPAIEQTGETFALLDAWQGKEDVVVTDAVVTGAPRGTVNMWDASDPVEIPFAPGPSTHGFGVGEAIHLARELGQLPRRLRIVGIEGAEFAEGRPPDAVLENAVECAAAQIVQLVERT
jgi:hydrogenase maturation protease